MSCLLQPEMVYLGTVVSNSSAKLWGGACAG